MFAKRSFASVSKFLALSAFHPWCLCFFCFFRRTLFEMTHISVNFSFHGWDEFSKTLSGYAYDFFLQTNTFSLMNVLHVVDYPLNFLENIQNYATLPIFFLENRHQRNFLIPPVNPRLFAARFTPKSIK